MITPQRQQLLYRLHRDRKVCALCGEPGIVGHEALIRRAYVMHSKELLRRVTESPENVHWLCGRCHCPAIADTSENRAVLVRQSVERFGLAHMLAWLESLGLKEPQDFIHFVEMQALLACPQT